MNYFLLDYSEEGNQTETLELMKLLENDDHIRLIGVKEKTSFSLQIEIRSEPATVDSLCYC